ncbi:MAG: hypothetical protein N2Z76_07380 [Treponemataceae bacterium]|nr:hypothetical protein [Treponemataceae bacterium]
MKKYKSILCFVLFLWKIPFYLQSQPSEITKNTQILSPRTSSSSQQKGSQKTVFPFFFLYSLAKTPSEWNPHWPALLPPDSLMVNSQEGASLQITIVGKDMEYQIRLGKEGKPLKIPFFYGEAFHYLQFEWNAQGGLEKLFLSSASGKEEELYQIIQREGETITSLAYQKGGETFFIYLTTQAETVEEVWYTAEGEPQIFFHIFSQKGSIHKIAQITDGDTIDFLVREYTSFLKLSFEMSNNKSYEILYGTKERPRYVRMKTFEPFSTDSTQNSTTASRDMDVKKENKEEQWYYQYDGLGRLVRLVYPDREYRYEYENDPRGQWVRCRITPYVPRFGVMVPSQPFELTRMIQYAKE